ncbi:MAG TPA: bifunctional proline dehydrogenase/L-glutamate gamma-semialdehyde dehydrogenase PutA [Casimicrobiaceae bacterium]|nr:bifunctional proline dehydrogenase/L-glutamate gamma-semialdehyde dehydrogenase PutA [Casimicrobiaceae bacterium]
MELTQLSLAAARERIRDAHRAAEPAAVLPLISEAALPPPLLARAQALAARLAEGVRAARHKAGGVDALMLEFSLDSREGIALMCLAEALLRIPDTATRDRLIRDKIGRGDWRAHIGRSPSFFVNAAAWGLLVTGKLVDSRSEGSLEQALASLLRKGGEPLIRKGVDLAMRLLGQQFVLGRTIGEALDNARERASRGYRHSFDMLGEAALTRDDAARYLAAYEDAIRVIGATARGAGVYAGPGISIKLSALHPRYVRSQRERVMRELYRRVLDLAALARSFDIGFNVDAEEADRLELSLDLFEALAGDPALEAWDGLGFVVQTYQKRARAVTDWLVALARARQRRFMVRLVKGAYWDSEIKRAQVEGLSDYPVFTRKVHSDVAYLACAKAMLAAPDAIYPQFASHNAFTIAAIHTLAEGADYEFQCLHGMGESVYDQVVGGENLGGACRIYAPVGSHETLLAYLVRRLLENGSNSSFVNRVVDPSVAIADLVADPVARAGVTRGTPHPRIPRPVALYPDRRNSRGRDFSDERVIADMEVLMAAVEAPAHAAPILADAPARRRASRTVVNPADHADVVGTVEDADAGDVAHAITRAASGGAAWSALAVDARAVRLERAADLLEEEAPALMRLAVREAGKSLPNAQGEVREAADFCRYYAAQARSALAGTTPRGPMACIAPWNFPLAIFVGQAAAALAAGNPVLAKPAEQTPLIAAAAVRLFHRAGVPHDALQLLPGPGETVGAALVADARIAGVLFTGSTEVARLIQRTLAKRTDDPVLVAETGGQNAMIVDSSALPEQVVADAVASAFDSAGQRCSALRILCVQDDIADRVLPMLRGAMEELRIGDPRLLASDVGPVIDEEARQKLEAHVAQWRFRGAHVFSLPLPAACANGTFVAPALIEIADPRVLTHEVFGPVLHVARFHEGELPALIDAINAAGYGLTHGIQSRIDETVELIASRVRAGNVYVNRNIIGAVVGVQPFGGEGLSGTGPKAGGPHYLWRLVRERDPATGPLPVLLSGPTGESNALSLHPRGRVACIAPTREERDAQATLATSLGNAIVDTIAPPPDAVLFAGSEADAAALREALAAGEGPIVPIVERREGRYDGARLLAERTLTINTTASGGNASLLSLEESEPA